MKAQGTPFKKDGRTPLVGQPFTHFFPIQALSEQQASQHTKETATPGMSTKSELCTRSITALCTLNLSGHLCVGLICLKITLRQEPHFVCESPASKSSHSCSMMFVE